LGSPTGSKRFFALCSGPPLAVRATGFPGEARRRASAARRFFLYETGGKPMRNLLALLAVALITLVALGWYLDWYKISNTPANGGHRQVNIDLNTPKIGHDVEKGGEKIRKMLEKNSKKDTVDPAEAVKKEPILPASN
jgi:hypothetical protein